MSNGFASDEGAARSDATGADADPARSAALSNDVPSNDQPPNAPASDDASTANDARARVAALIDQATTALAPALAAGRKALTPVKLLLLRIRDRVARWMLRDPSRKERRRKAQLAIGLAALGPILAIATYGVLSSADQTAIDSTGFQLLKAVDFLYILLLIVLIGAQIARLIIARRARSAGSKMHMRMVSMFAGVAAAPTLLVAAFFIFVIQLSFDAWFSDQVGSVVRTSRQVAEAYGQEHRQAIRGQALALAQRIETGADRMIGGLDDRRFPILLEAAIEESGFSDVYILNSSAEVVARGSLSFLFAYTPPTLEDLEKARNGEMVIQEDVAANEMRALVRLGGLFDAFLYVTRPVDGAVLASLERTNQSVALYNRLEQNRDRWLVQFAAIYLGFAVLVVMAAVYLGLWFAERLARPIGRLAAAAQRIRSGDLYVRVKEEKGEDEIALLSRTFNRMTEEVKRKQDALTVANSQLDDRRRFTEAVLSGVTAGVIGLDPQGRIRLMNRAAAEVLDVEPAQAVGRTLIDLAPECATLLQDAGYDPTRGVERSIRIVRGNKERELLARLTSQREALEPDGQGGARTGGYVVTLDDLTALVSAQRMAAWGDVARRIAHEIKNPLTPIQLAAERLRRKYRDQLGDDGESFERYTETIVRQTGDIGRMVDAFVRFAKMPSPRMAMEPIEKLVREAMLLQEEARAEIAYSYEGLAEPNDEDGVPLAVRCDRGQLHQALTNMLQNAADAIHGRQEREAADGVQGAPGEIRVRVTREGERSVAVTVSDNGVGLPTHERRRLLEPYVTTREKGAGLGLAIVSKIVEEHSATFELLDAEPFSEGARPGACAKLVLPLASSREVGREQTEQHEDEDADRRSESAMVEG